MQIQSTDDHEKDVLELPSNSNGYGVKSHLVCLTWSRSKEILIKRECYYSLKVLEGPGHQIEEEDAREFTVVQAPAMYTGEGMGILMQVFAIY